MPNPAHRLVGVIEWDASWDSLARSFCHSSISEWGSKPEHLDYAVCEFAIRRDRVQTSRYPQSTAIIRESTVRADGETLSAELELELDDFLCGCR